MNELPPLSKELAALREAARPPRPPAGFEERVAAKLAQSMLTIPQAPSPTGAVTAGAQLPLAKLISGGVLVLLTGVGLGVALDRNVLQPPPVVAPPSVPVAPVVVPVAPVVVPEPPPVEPPKVVVPPPPKPVVPVVEAPPKPVVPVVEAPANPVGGRDVSLSAERALLEVARAAMAKGDLPTTFTALEKHERDFANGRLVEEREALFIQALHAAGREAEAASRTERFNKQFPDSLLAP